MLLKSLLLLFFFYCLLLLYVFFNQSNMMYFPSADIKIPAAIGLPKMQSVAYTTSDKLSLRAWYQPAQKGYGTLVYFHGNAGNASHRAPLVRAYLDAGYGVLLAEYRGYGGNSGKPSEAGLIRDGEAALAFLSKQGIKANCTILFGESLGSAISLAMAAKNPVAALVLQAPFASMLALAKHHYPFYAYSALLRDHYNNSEYIETIKAPVLVLQGEQDKVVPIAFGRAVYQLLSSKKQFISYPQRGHNDLPTQTLNRDVLTFLQSISFAHC